MSARLAAPPALWLLAVLLACGDGPPPRTAATAASSGGARLAVAPAAETPRPPPPPPADRVLSARVRVPLDLIAALIDAALPREQAQGWQALTQPGQSPSLEARYQLWREDVRLRFTGSSLHMEVPLRFAARFNARVKNPFGGKWLTLARDEPWGTEDEPQRVALRLRTTVAIDDDWRLRLRTTVARPQHGPPPGGKLCTGGSFKLCVSKASLAPEVQRRIDGELLPRMRDAVAELDRRIEKQVDLRRSLQRAWSALWKPLQLPQESEHAGYWLQLQPKRAALTLAADGDAVLIEPALLARMSFHHGRPRHAPAPIPLPPPAPRDELKGESYQLSAAMLPAALLQHIGDLIER